MTGNAELENVDMFILVDLLVVAYKKTDKADVLTQCLIYISE